MKGNVWIWLLGGALIVVACTNQLRAQTTPGPRGPRVPSVEQPDPVSFNTLAELGPQVVPYDKASLIFSGTPVPVSMVTSDKDGKLDMSFITHGEVLMTENYKYDGSSFSFVGSTGEQYDPPLQLLNFPFNTNDKRTWKGTIHYGDAAETGEATITAKPDTLNMSGGNFQTVNVNVTLNYNGGGQKPTVRTLKFWFAPKKGVIKRDFGLNSTREPLATAVADKP